MDKGLKLLEVIRDIKTSELSLYRKQLEKDAFRLQQDIGDENIKRLKIEARSNPYLKSLLKRGEIKSN